MLSMRAEDNMRYKTLLLGTTVALLSGTAAASADRGAPSRALGELSFQFDSTALMDSAPGVLGEVAKFASANPESKIVLDAHCDSTGASTYNVKLAIRRAEQVRDGLKAAGVPEHRIVFAVYGEDGKRRATAAADRRVTIWSTREPLAAVIDHTFARNGEAVTWQLPQSVAQIEGRDEVASR